MKAMMLLAAVMGPLLTAGAGCDECDNADAYWCDGNKRKSCKDSGGGGHVPSYLKIETEDCERDGLVCHVESGEARCVLEEPRCGEGMTGTAVCVGDVRAVCGSQEGFALPDRSCPATGDAPYCVESGRAARCSPFEELCEPEGLERCALGDVLSCTDRIWNAPYESTTRCFDECSTPGDLSCRGDDIVGHPPRYLVECRAALGRWVQRQFCRNGCVCESETAGRCTCAVSANSSQ